MTPLSVSFLAIVTRSGGKSATVWDAIKNEPMRTLTKEPPHRPTGFGADLEQDIPTQQRRKGHNPLLMRRRSHRNGGGRIKYTTH